MGLYAMERARVHIADLASRGLDTTSFFQEVGEVIARAVPAAGRPAWSTVDPATLLATSYYDPESAEGELEFVQWAYRDEDWAPLAELAHSPQGVMLYGPGAITGGGQDRYAEQLQACGAEQILLLALRSRAGETWGSMDLWRERGEAGFAADEVAFLRHASAYLAEGARRGLLIGEALDPESADAPGLVVLNSSSEIESATPGVEHWLADLPGRWSADGSLPTAVASVAATALRGSAGQPPEGAMARVLARSGRWVMLHGTALQGGARRRVAVIVESAHPVRISPLLMAAYGLTEREQEVARMVLGGNSTNDIAAGLHVSPNTVQQHLKSVFEKIGVRSRRELVSRVFLSHYEPRVEDNGQRVRIGRPVRGGPLARPSAAAGQPLPVADLAPGTAPG